MHEATRRVLGVLLRHLDGFDSAGKRTVVIGATNRKQVGALGLTRSWPAADACLRAAQPDTLVGVHCTGSNSNSSSGCVAAGPTPLPCCDSLCFFFHDCSTCKLCCRTWTQPSSLDSPPASTLGCPARRAGARMRRQQHGSSFSGGSAGGTFLCWRKTRGICSPHADNLTVPARLPACLPAGRAEILRQYARHLGDAELLAVAHAAPGLAGRDLKDLCEQAERRWASKVGGRGCCQQGRAS